MKARQYLTMMFVVLALAGLLAARAKHVFDDESVFHGVAFQR